MLRSASRRELPVHRIEAPASTDPEVSFETISDSHLVRSAHRHAFAQFIVIDAGEGEHVIDGIAYPVHPGAVHTVAPGQVHFWRMTSELTASALMFSEGFLAPLGPLPPSLKDLLLLGRTPALPDPASLTAIRSILAAFDRAVDERSRRHLAFAFLWELAGIPTHAPRPPAQLPLVRQFLGLALRSPNARTTVASCARQLSVTPGHLSEQVTAETGKTPGHILRQAVSREAERLLLGTDLSAAQIAQMLGFSEPSYFSRFFRREVGQTPSEFRERQAPAQHAQHAQQAS